MKKLLSKIFYLIFISSLGLITATILLSANETVAAIASNETATFWMTRISIAIALAIIINWKTLYSTE